MKKVDESLYFIALIPQEPLLSDFMALKRDISNRFSTKAALKSPPHITLHMPFQLKENKRSILMERLSCISFDPFPIKISGFGAFPPRVIYANILPDKQLTTLWKDTVKIMRIMGYDNASYKNRGFTPHMTLAFRDLKKPQFKLAWEEFQHKHLEAEFLADQFWLLKHNGKMWEKEQSFSFQNKWL